MTSTATLKISAGAAEGARCKPTRVTTTLPAIQTMKTGSFLHPLPLPSGQQQDALSVAEAVLRLLPESQIQNDTARGVESIPALHEPRRAAP